MPDADSERWVSYTIDDLYPEWQRRAHCSGVGVAYYFGDDDEQPTMSIKQVRRASKLCEVCPVYEDCLRWALTAREEYGVWAGTSGRVRRRIFKMVDNGLTSVDEVVERFCNGQGDIYRYPQERSSIAQPQAQGKESVGHSSPAAFPARGGAGAVGEGDRGLRVADRREATG